MQDQIFIDGIGEVRLVDGIIRMDLVALSARRRTKEGGPPPEFVTQLVMSPDAFMRMIRGLGETVRTLQDRGVLVRTDGDGGEGDAAAAGDSGEAAAASPNFD